MDLVDESSQPFGVVEEPPEVLELLGAESARNDPPHHLHGLYVQWSYTVDNKRFTRWLVPEQQERYRGPIEAGKQLRELLKELERAEILSVERADGWGR